VAQCRKEGFHTTPLLQRDEDRQQTASRWERAKRFADYCAERPQRISGFHRMTGRRRRRQEIAHFNGRILSIDFAVNLTHQRNCRPVVLTGPLVENNAWSQISSARDNPRDFPVVFLRTGVEQAVRVKHHECSRLYLIRIGHIEGLGAVSIAQQDVARLTVQMYGGVIKAAETGWFDPA
jgi:hypothetical protein